MAVCKICRDDITNGQSIAVISFPVKCTSDSGDYSFLGDFSNNEQTVHLKCLRQIASQLVEILSPNSKTKPNTNTDAQPVPTDRTILYQALADLGVDCDMVQVTQFINAHPAKGTS
jgi:hypothetical protein